MRALFKAIAIGLASACVGLGAAFGAWLLLGHAPVWPPQPQLAAWALGVTAAATLLWAWLLWAFLAWREARRVRAQGRRSQVAELTQQMVLTLDTRGRVDWANAAFSRRTDRHGPHVLGREVAVVLGLPAGDERGQLEQAVDAGQALDLAVHGSDLHGNPLHLQLELQPLRDAKGRPQGAVLIALDGSTQAEAAAHQAAQQAAEEAELSALYATQEAERAAERAALQAERAEMADERLRQHDALDRTQAHLAALQSQLAGGQEALENLSSALEGAGVGTWTAELGTQRVQLNATAVHLLGRALGAELSVTGWLAQVHPDDLPLAREQLAPLLAGAQNHFELPLRVRHGDGHWLHLLLRGGVTQHGLNGEPERVAGTVQPQAQALDTAQRQARLLADAEALHGAAAFALAEPMLMLEASPQLLQLLGLPTDAPAPDWGQLLSYAADDEHRQAWQAVLDDALASTEPIGWDLTLPLRTALGQLQWVQCRARAIDEDSEGLRRWVGVLQAVAEPARIDLAVPDKEPEAVRIDLALPDPDPELEVRALQRANALRHFGGDITAFARASRLLAPTLLNLPAQLRHASGPEARRQLLRRAEMLSRSLGATLMAEHLQAAAADPNDQALAALRTEIDGVVDALQQATH